MALLCSAPSGVGCTAAEGGLTLGGAVKIATALLTRYTAPAPGLQALPTLEPIILTSKAVASRVAAIDALGMLCFVASEGPHESLPVMALLARSFARGE